MTKTPNPKTVAKALTPAVNTLLLAMANAELLREEVDGYKAALLAEGSYTDETGKPVTEPKYDWTMGDDQFPGYLAKLEAKVKEAGHNVPKDQCPALIAESLQNQAEWAVIEAAEPFFGVTNSQLLCGTKTEDGLTTQRKYLDLCIGLVVNFPGYEKPSLSAS
jgi:hypothetical protein